mmetsp:Transcript_45779/g.118437  ORF Transcript_45779/g.118437 Transcript_45779/m.118437 type:complete len:215 (-) Transcript_45779:57-701(-)
MPSERFISTSTLSMAARAWSGLLGSSRCAVPFPPPPWTLLMRPFSQHPIAATAAMNSRTHCSRARRSVTSTEAWSSESTTNGGVGAPTASQMRLKPIFSSAWLAAASVPGHTSPIACTARAASEDSAKADQPGMKTTSPRARSWWRLWSCVHRYSRRSAKWLMLPHDFGFTKMAPSTPGSRWLPSSRVCSTRTLLPHTARMSASTEFVACLDWL